MKPASLTDDAIGPLLRRLTTPMAAALLLTASFALVDTFFVSRLGTTALAGLAYALAVVSIVVHVTMGLGAGVTAAVAAAVGRDGAQAGAIIARQALVLALLVGLGLTGLGLLVRTPVLAVMGAVGPLEEQAAGYLTVWFAGLVFAVVNNVGVAVLRGVGDTKSTAYALLIAAVLNAVLDPLFIFGWGPVPAFGIEGAALATVTGYFGATVFALARVRKGFASVHVQATATTFWRASGSIGRIALPVAASRATTPVGVALFTAIVARFGDDAAAAMGIYSRISMLVLMIPTALGATMVAVVGQNWAAGKRQRVQHAVALARRSALVWGLGTWVVLALVSGALGFLFSRDDEVIHAVATFLRLAPCAFAPAGIIAVAASAFVGAGQARRALWLVALNQFVFAVPCAFVFGHAFGLQGALVGNGFGHLASLVVCRRWLAAEGFVDVRNDTRDIAASGTSS